MVFHQMGRRPRASFGIIYPTDFSAYLFYGSLVYCYIRKEFITYIEIGVVAALGIFVYVFCDARLNTVCLFLTAAIFGYNKIRCNFAKKAGKQYEMNTAFSYLLAVSTTLCAILSIVASIFYSSDNKLMLLADRIFNNRLRMGKKGIDLYGFSLTGQYIPMQGNGGTEKEPLHYFFLDNSYMYVVLQLGLIFLCIVLFGFMLIGFRARREKNWVLMGAIAIMSVKCIVEHHILEVMYNPFLWAVFADTNIIPIRVRKKKQKEGECI